MNQMPEGLLHLQGADNAGLSGGRFTEEFQEEWRAIMDELRTQQIEALQTAVPYCEKIIRAMGNIIDEFLGDRKEDTDEYMNSIINGLNWIFEVYNGTQALVNENAAIDKEKANQFVGLLNEANTENNDLKRAEALKGIRTFVEQFKAEAEKHIAG